MQTFVLWALQGINGTSWKELSLQDIQNLWQTMLRENFAGETYHLLKARAAYLMKWSTRCRELAEAEEKLHASFPPYLQHVLKGKRILLMKETLTDLEYPDSKLMDEMAAHGISFFHGQGVEQIHHQASGGPCRSSHGGGGLETHP